MHLPWLRGAQASEVSVISQWYVVEKPAFVGRMTYSIKD